MRSRLSALLVAVAAVLCMAAGGCRSEPGKPASPRWAVPVALPGAEPFDAETRRRLSAALQAEARGESETDALEAAERDAEGGPPYTNRMLLERSSFLRRQAHSPVDWRAWSRQALEEAERLGRPVLMVVGFSSCPGCHRLEREALADPGLAELINLRFVPVLVDRDERPDLDAVYMQAVKLRSGTAGWPAVLFLTAQGLPFDGVSYGPAADSTRMLHKVIERVAREAELRPDAVQVKAATLTERMRSLSGPRAAGDMPAAASVFAALLFDAAGIFDREDGGFGDSPRFLRPPLLDFLLRYQRRSGQTAALQMAETTLEAANAGALHDVVAGGFHRYARGPDWENPSYEKTLADNALAASVYLEAWRATGREDFRRTARTTLDFLLSDLADPELPGAFDQALDSQSPGPDGRPCEGCYYRLDPADRQRALDSPDVRAGLLRARRLRPAPLRDDKVAADANGMALSALARGAGAFADAAYRTRAIATADFLLSRMVVAGRPVHCVQRGGACPDGYLDDSAFVANGLLDLFEVDSQPRWLQAAMTIADDMLARFEHEGVGGFFFTSAADDNPVLRLKPDFDGAQPSGNAAAVQLLLRLEALTDRTRYREAAARTLRALGQVLTYRPLAAPGLASGLDAYVDSFKEVLILVPPGADASALEAVVQRTQVPDRSLVVTPTGARLEELSAMIPALAGKRPLGAQATAFVCEQHVCRPATTDPQALAASLAGVMPLPPE